MGDSHVSRVSQIQELLLDDNDAQDPKKMRVVTPRTLAFYEKRFPHHQIQKCVKAPTMAADGNQRADDDSSKLRVARVHQTKKHGFGHLKYVKTPLPSFDLEEPPFETEEQLRIESDSEIFNFPQKPCEVKGIDKEDRDEVGSTIEKLVITAAPQPLSLIDDDDRCAEVFNYKDNADHLKAETVGLLNFPSPEKSLLHVHRPTEGTSTSD